MTLISRWMIDLYVDENNNLKVYGQTQYGSAVTNEEIAKNLARESKDAPEYRKGRPIITAEIIARADNGEIISYKATKNSEAK